MKTVLEHPEKINLKLTAMADDGMSRFCPGEAIDEYLRAIENPPNGRRPCMFAFAVFSGNKPQAFVPAMVINEGTNIGFCSSVLRLRAHSEELSAEIRKARRAGILQILENHPDIETVIGRAVSPGGRKIIEHQDMEYVRDASGRKIAKREYDKSSGAYTYRRVIETS